MHDKRAAVTRLLQFMETAWPRIQQIEWQFFGSLSRYEPDGGQLKYQDGLLLVYEGDVLLRSLELGNPSQDRLVGMTEVADRKVSLSRRTPHGYSAALRDPEQGKWAGGIRVPGTNLYFALTGLPEVADHLLLAIQLLRVRLITSDQHALLIDFVRAIGLADAARRVSLDTNGFRRLYRELEQKR